MKKNIFSLCRTFTFAVMVSALFVSLVSCDPDNSFSSSESDGFEDTTSEVAVTGKVNDLGANYAEISGYANLNLLPDGGSGNPVIGVELVEADAESNDAAIQSITASLVGNTFVVSFSALFSTTKYRYRSFVKYGGLTYYGKYKEFTTELLREAVDLGLSVKWASCNIGAKSPEDFGGYYAWGETEEKTNYSWSTYKWCRGSYDSQIKYCTSGYYGTVDNKTNLDLEDDVAHVKWGGDWRMPTKAEQDELLKKCSWSQTRVNGVYGYRVQGPSGNNIFLPAAESRGRIDVGVSGSNGYYWSATLDSEDSNWACNIYFFEGYYGQYHDRGRSDRFIGYSIRPVTK